MLRPRLVPASLATIALTTVSGRALAAASIEAAPAIAVKNNRKVTIRVPVGMAVGLENGAGDGLVTQASVGTAGHPNWDGVIDVIALGAGLHNLDPANPATPAYWNDPVVVGIVLAKLLGPVAP